MEIFLYLIIFLMGTLFGSFYTLAIYRIPNKIDITHTHSFCPNCKHKLGFFELIPVWSYIFLGGKCKECKQKIRPRYLIIEIISGIVFVLLALGLKISFYNIEISSVIKLGFLALYLSAIAIIAGIDKENRNIEKSVIYYAIGISVLYIIYLCIIDKNSIYRYVMYLATMLVLQIIHTVFLKQKTETKYIISILILIMVMVIFTGEIATILTIVMTLLMILTYIILVKLQKNTKTKGKNEKNYKDLRLGYFLCASNVLAILALNFILNYIVKMKG